MNRRVSLKLRAISVHASRSRLTHQRPYSVASVHTGDGAGGGARSERQRCFRNVIDDVYRTHSGTTTSQNPRAESAPNSMATAVRRTSVLSADSDESTRRRWARAALAEGADVDAPDPKALTPLHWGGKCSRPDDIAELLKAGAAVDCKNKGGVTRLSSRRGIRGVGEIGAAAWELGRCELAGEIASVPACRRVFSVFSEKGMVSLCPCHQRTTLGRS
jgi:hypothetical protein